MPFECAFVDLKKVDDELLKQSDSTEAAIGLMSMKYAFDADKFSAVLDDMEPLFRKMENARGTSLAQKIELYLGEYITEEALEKLKMAFKSLGERLGFVSAGDVRRAREKRIRENAQKRGEAKGRKQERAKAEEEKLASAREMLKDGDSVEKICRVLKLSEERVRALL